MSTVSVIMKFTKKIISKLSEERFMAEDKTLEEVLMDYLKSIKKRNREGLTDEQRSDLKSI